MTDYLREYKGYCLTCKNYDLERKSDATTRGFRCTYHGRPMAMDEKCPHYSKDIVRSNSFIGKYFILYFFNNANVIFIYK